jgi:hypothetical protein
LSCLISIAPCFIECWTFNKILIIEINLIQIKFKWWVVLNSNKSLLIVDSPSKKTVTVNENSPLQRERKYSIGSHQIKGGFHVDAQSLIAHLRLFQNGSTKRKLLKHQFFIIRINLQNYFIFSFTSFFKSLLFFVGDLIFKCPTGWYYTTYLESWNPVK